MEESKQADEVRTVEGLMPCPFCGAEMTANTNIKDIYVRRYGAHYLHPQSPYCVLGDFEISPSEVEAWNRRATQAQQGEPVAWRFRLKNWVDQKWMFMERSPDPSMAPHCDIEPLYAAPSTPARQAVRMLTDAEFQDTRDKWIATGIGSLSEAIQRKFCEVNALPLEQQEGGK